MKVPPVRLKTEIKEEPSSNIPSEERGGAIRTRDEETSEASIGGRDSVGGPLFSSRWFPLSALTALLLDAVPPPAKTSTAAATLFSFKPKAATKPTPTATITDLKQEISFRIPGHIETVLHDGLETMEPGIKTAVIKAYPNPNGTLNESKFLEDFTQVAVEKLRGLDWKKIIGEKPTGKEDSKADTASFELEDVHGSLEDVGKDIVAGAVFVEATEDRVIRTLTDTRLFPRYGTTFGIGITTAADCAPGHVTITFGGTLKAVAVRVVNRNRNLLRERGIQHWRLAANIPSGCPPIVDIKTNIGIQSIFPYKRGETQGFVVTYILMATPGIQLFAKRAMNNTLDAIEEIAEGL